MVRVRWIAALTVGWIVGTYAAFLYGTMPPWHDTRRGHIFHPPTVTTPRLVYWSTAYCHCKICTGQWAVLGGVTASGKMAVEGVTVAADPALWKMGSCVMVQGMGKRRVQDTGADIKGYSLDVYFADHQRAKAFGTRWVWVRKC